MGKKSGSGSGMNNNPDHISGSLKNNFRVKILKFFDADPGSGMKKIGIRDGKNWDPGWKKLGSGICDNHPGSATMFTHAQIRIKLFI
jgi:hypothetical protein